MRRSCKADRLLRILYRSGRLGQLTRNELRMYLLLLFPIANPTGSSPARRSELRRALRLTADEVDRAAFGLERRKMVRITRKPRTWVVRLRRWKGR